MLFMRVLESTKYLNILKMDADMQNYSGLSLNDRLMGSKTSSKEGFVSFELSQDDPKEIFEGSANKVNLSFYFVVIVSVWNFASFVKIILLK
jgi:hypothetical protein